MERLSAASGSEYAFVNDAGNASQAGILGYQHPHERKTLQLSCHFVLDCLGRTLRSGLRRACVGVFTVLRLIGLSTVTISHRCACLTPGTWDEKLAGWRR